MRKWKSRHKQQLELPRQQGKIYVWNCLFCVKQQSLNFCQPATWQVDQGKKRPLPAAHAEPFQQLKQARKELNKATELNDRLLEAVAKRKAGMGKHKLFISLNRLKNSFPLFVSALIGSKINSLNSAGRLAQAEAG